MLRKPEIVSYIPVVVLLFVQSLEECRAASTSGLSMGSSKGCGQPPRWAVTPKDEPKKKPVECKVVVAIGPDDQL